MSTLARPWGAMEAAGNIQSTVCHREEIGMMRPTPLYVLLEEARGKSQKVCGRLGCECRQSREEVVREFIDSGFDDMLVG